MKSAHEVLFNEQKDKNHGEAIYKTGNTFAGGESFLLIDEAVADRQIIDGH